jgi:hypothetical protein
MPFGLLLRFIYDFTSRHYNYFYNVTRTKLTASLLPGWFLVFRCWSDLTPLICSFFQSRAEQKLTTGNQPARSLLESSPAGTHGHIFVQCQDFCFFFSFDVPPLIKRKGLDFFIIGVPLLHLFPLFCSVCYMLQSDGLEDTFFKGSVSHVLCTGS